MCLETYAKQMATWTGINEDVPEYVKYHDLNDDLKRNKDKKGLQKFVGEHVLMILKDEADQTIKRVFDILKIKYGRSTMEKVEEYIRNRLGFKENDYEEEDEFL